MLSTGTDIAVVGLSYNAVDGYVPYVQELTWEEDRRVTGSLFTPGETGPRDPVPTTITDLIHAPGGGVRLIDSSGNFEAGNRLGTRFDTPGGYPLGWAGAEQGVEADARAEVAAILQRSTDAEGADLTGTWTVQFTQVLGSLVYTRSGTLSLTPTGGFFALAFGSPGDPVFAGQGFEFTGDPENGRFPVRMGNGDTGFLYLSEDKSVIAFVDLDETDSDTWMGIGVRRGSALKTSDIVGSYRAGVLFESQRLSDASDGDLTTAWRIDLAADGTFEIFDLGESDAGETLIPELSGTWAANAGAVTLTDPDLDAEVLLTISDNGLSGIVTGITVQDLISPERPMGLLSKVSSGPAQTIETTVFSAVLDADGQPLVYDLRQPDDAWSVADLGRFSIPDPDFPESDFGVAATDIGSFQTPDGQLVAVVNSAETLLAYERDDEGFWHAKDLIRSLSGAEAISSRLTVFVDRDGIGYVAGVTEEGEVVTYEFDPDPDDGQDAWSYANISEEHLTPRGQATPVFVGPLTSFITPWNALNIVGLDAEGNIQAVWTGNGGIEWNASNLSQITGAPALVSGLTAFVTSWKAINIVGLDGEGNVLATWWVPAFGGNWQVVDLTANVGSTPLAGDSLTSFIAPWGALNIIGRTGAGDVVAYWWTPTIEDGRWQVANLTASFGPDDPKPDAQLRGQAGTDFGGELSILGTASESGDLIRLFFRVNDDVWASENVTAIARYV